MTRKPGILLGSFEEPVFVLIRLPGASIKKPDTCKSAFVVFFTKPTALHGFT